MTEVDLSPITDSSDPLAALRLSRRARHELERAEAVLVRRARNDGVSWAAIAEALGVSRQAVHKKYGGRRLLGRSD
ncbi:helix-turn-helix domain-containing protein [Streptomyces triticirhizae]|uniref:HTH domain-containing protein n=1 Tax=Streptomyces triticirhizae TaxID=2483353 RepID=A0A3M2KYC5_9ACTN|nr:helix-turn-helix domain-containing protein [Streptomyces triticirhizae]RMI30261.1 HTH domain-containing protein [Streptomyces triticirhizae]